MIVTVHLVSQTITSLTVLFCRGTLGWIENSRNPVLPSFYLFEACGVLKMSSKTLTPPIQLPRKELAAVLDLCRKLNAERNFPELLKVLSQEAAKVLQAESTSILIYDREKLTPS